MCIVNRFKKRIDSIAFYTSAIAYVNCSYVSIIIKDEFEINMKEHSNGNNAINRWTTVLFLIYLIVISWILLFKLGVQFTYMDKRSVNLIPFRNTGVLNGENILNVVIFVPLGIYTGILFGKWSFAKKFLFIFSISFLVEGLQYLLGIGAFDVTDLITNTFGGVIGLILYIGLEKVINSKRKTQKIINLLAAAGTVLMILLLTLLKMNMLPVRYQ